MKKSSYSLLEQIKTLDIATSEYNLTSFEQKLRELDVYPLTASGITTLQLNTGRLCNQACLHCHVAGSPGSEEVMSKETFQFCLDALDKTDIPIVDITGGAPELNPNFKWFVSELKKRGVKTLVRCNLTILFEPGMETMTDFFAKNTVEVIASLPSLSRQQTDAQRGEGIFSKSIDAIKLLNAKGYGKEDSGLIINLVMNPAGAFLPGNQSELEAQWKKELDQKYGVIFNNLYTITNMPVGRFLNFLESKGLLKKYLKKLFDQMNPAAVQSLMCRFTLSVDWEGYLYDCDFNQMLGLKVYHELPTHINDFDPEKLNERRIMTMLHCYGCTAGLGSSCGGALSGA